MSRCIEVTIDIIVGVIVSLPVTLIFICLYVESYIADKKRKKNDSPPLIASLDFDKENSSTISNQSKKKK